MKHIHYRAGAILVLWLAAALSFHLLGAQSFWNDEGNSARLSERSPALIVAGAAGDIHPPLYYLFLRGWRELAGDSEFGLRAFSAFATIGVVATVTSLGLTLAQRSRKHAAHRQWSLFVPGSALAAGLLAALNPALIYYAQEARMYALLALWSVLSALLLVKLLRNPFSIPLAAAYIAASAAGLYTHYVYPVVLLWQTILVAFWLFASRRYRFVLRWLVIMLVTFLLYVPWLPIFIRQVGGRQGDAASLGSFLRSAAQFMMLGPTSTSDRFYLLYPIFGLLLLSFLIGAMRTLRRTDTAPADRLLTAVMPLLALTLPPLIMGLAGITQPAFHKFLLVSVPFTALAAGAGLILLLQVAGAPALLRSSPARTVLQIGALCLLAGYAVVALSALRALYFDPAYARADYQAMAARIAADRHANAGVILNAANQWEVFTYYHRAGAPVYPLPAGRPDAARIDRQLAEIAEKHDRLYVLFWGEAERDPERLVERWLDTHAFKAGEEWVGDVRFVTYSLPGAQADEMATPRNVRFGDQITLLGYTLASDRATPGDILQLTLFWQSNAAVGTLYKVFLHLVDEQGRIVAQRDSEPGGGSAPTTAWEPGTIVADNHGILLPTELAPGNYLLLLGLYDLLDPTNRLPVMGASGSVLGDHLELATITLQR